MKVLDTSPRGSETKAIKPMSPDEIQELMAQLQDAFPTATEKFLATAIEESRKEIQDPDDRQKLIRCVVERITT